MANLTPQQCHKSKYSFSVQTNTKLTLTHIKMDACEKVKSFGETIWVILCIEVVIKIAEILSKAYIISHTKIGYATKQMC